MDTIISYRGNDGATTHPSVSIGVSEGGVLSPTLFNITFIGLVYKLSGTVQSFVYENDIGIWASGIFECS